MIDRLAKPDTAPLLALGELSFRSSLPLFLGVAALIGIIVLAAWLYRGAPLPHPAARWGLGALRAGLLALLLVMLFEPVSNVEVTETRRNTLLVLADVSGSMALADARDETASLEDAAMALGEMPFPAPRGRAALAESIRHLRQAAGRQDPASDRRAIAAAQQALARAIDEAGPAGEMREALRAIAEPLGALAAGDGEGEAAPQAEKIESVLAALREAEGRWRAASPEAAPDSLPEGAAHDTADLDERALRSATRFELARGLLTRPEGFWEALEAELAVRHFAFGEDLYPAKGEAELDRAARLGREPEDTATEIGSALAEAAARYAGHRMAGVVLLTDGGSNGGADPVEIARELGRRGMPIYPVGIGEAAPDDIAARRLFVQETVFSRDEVSVRVQIDSRGYAGRQTRVSLDLAGEAMAARRITLEGGTQFEEIVFTPGPIAGHHDLEVRVEPLPGELTEANNRIERTIHVIDEKIQVLYVESAPRWEYRYLRAVLRRDHRLDVKFLMTEGDPELARADPEHLAHFPHHEEEAFEYDAVILGDVRADYFSAEQLESIAALVRERSGSLLMIAGRRHAPETYRQTVIEPLLPVEVAGGWVSVDPATHPVPTPEGLSSMMAALDPDPAENARIWRRVRPLERLPRLDGTRPGATVIAELSGTARRAESYPLISWQRYGSGQTMFVATDHLWRMRYKHGDRDHARFWGQAIQFLTLSRLLGEDQRVQIDAAPRQSHTGEEVQIFANVLSEAYEPVDLEQFEVRIAPPEEAGGGRRPLELQPVPETPGLYHGLYEPAREGVHRITAPEAYAEAANEVALTIRPLERELLEPALHREALEALAEASGGRYLEIRDLPALAGMLDRAPSTFTIRRQIELWDSWILLLLVVLLAGAEWSIRRRKNLV